SLFEREDSPLEGSIFIFKDFLLRGLAWLAGFDYLYLIVFTLLLALLHNLNCLILTRIFLLLLHFFRNLDGVVILVYYLPELFLFFDLHRFKRWRSGIDAHLHEQFAERVSGRCNLRETDGAAMCEIGIFRCACIGAVHLFKNQDITNPQFRIMTQ